MATRAEQSQLGFDALTEERGQEPARVSRPQVVAEQPLLGTYAQFVKPVLDRFGGIVLSILTIPMVLWIVPSLWIAIGRPAIFKQARVGKSGAVFTVYKFRTMHPDRRTQPIEWNEQERRMLHKTENDPRHTLLGRILRKWSLDEIPQFWNVALGQMSLVGPRPELIEIVATKYEPWQHQRHAVKPGVTGLWQVSERDNGKLMFECTEVDIEYTRTITFWNDLKILLKTMPSALGKRKGG
jgi:lipopolysaccharide/colanic/teichoic acid biosynthesis glycosyltransferase